MTYDYLEKKLELWIKTYKKYKHRVENEQNEEIKKAFQKTIDTKIIPKINEIRSVCKFINEIEYESSKKIMYGDINAMQFFFEYISEKYPDAYVYEINFKKELEEYKKTKGYINIRIIKG